MAKYKINKNILARNIKNIRLELGMNQEEFGKLFTPNADKSIVSRWERGKSIPNASRLKTISKKGNMKMMYLTTGKNFAKDLENDDLTEYGKYIRNEMKSLDSKHDDLFDTVTDNNNKEFLDYLEKELLINTTKLILMMKNTTNSNEVIGLLSTIISSPMQAKMNDETKEYFNELKNEESEYIKKFIELIQKSNVNNLNH